jgi:hypothetical protein
MRRSLDEPKIFFARPNSAMDERTLDHKSRIAGREPEFCGEVGERRCGGAFTGAGEIVSALGAVNEAGNSKGGPTV